MFPDPGLLVVIDDHFLVLFSLSIAANRDLLPGDSRGYRSAEEAARELTQGIRREGTKLAERWAALRDRTERWNVDLDTTTNVNASSIVFCLSFFPSSRLSSLGATWKFFRESEERETIVKLVSREFLGHLARQYRFFPFFFSCPPNCLF